jgi:purine-binding chemotaxis protein CheW
MVEGNEINRRLADIRIGLDRNWSPDAQETRWILKERARILARERMDQPMPGEQIEFLEFTLAQERYGIETTYIREVAPVAAMTRVPCTPAFVAGIINLRGQILSVIDLRKRFDLAEKGPADLGRVIVLGTEDMLMGVLAATIIGLHAISRQELETSLPTLTGRREQYLKGISRSRVAILDAQKLLSDQDIIVHAEVER